MIIHPANKGGAIVILNKEDCIAEMDKIPGDPNTYSRIHTDPTTTFKRSLTELVNEGYSLGILDKKERSCLVPLAPRIPPIYYLLKVHKDPVNPPGRPIVSGIDPVTSRIRKYVDFHLHPLVRIVPFPFESYW